MIIQNTKAFIYTNLIRIVKLLWNFKNRIDVSFFTKFLWNTFFDCLEVKMGNFFNYLKNNLILKNFKLFKIIYEKLEIIYRQ